MFGPTSPQPNSPYPVYTQPTAPPPFQQGSFPGAPPLFSGNSPPSLSQGHYQFVSAPVGRQHHALYGGGSTMLPPAGQGAGPGYLDPNRFTVSSSTGQPQVMTSVSSRRLYPTATQHQSPILNGGPNDINNGSRNSSSSGINASMSAGRPMPPPPPFGTYNTGGTHPHAPQGTGRRMLGVGANSSAHSDSSQASRRSTPSQSTGGGSLSLPVTRIHTNNSTTSGLPPNRIPNYGATPPASEDHRRRQRLKQVAFGKVTEGYKNYRLAVSRATRQEYNPDHPMTPDITSSNSKRHWDSLVGEWRRALHKWDTSAGPPNHRKAGLRTYGDLGYVPKATETPAAILQEIEHWRREVESHRKSDGAGDDDEDLWAGGRNHGESNHAALTMEQYELSPYVIGGGASAAQSTGITLELHGRTSSDGSLIRGPTQQHAQEPFTSAIVGPASQRSGGDATGAMGNNAYAAYHAELYEVPEGEDGALNVRKWQSEVQYDPSMYQAPSTSGSANPTGGGAGGSSSRYLSSHDGNDSNYGSDSCASRETPRSANIVPITTLKGAVRGSRGGSGRDLRAAGSGPSTARGHQSASKGASYNKSASPAAYMGSGSLSEGPAITVRMAGDKPTQQAILALLQEESKSHQLNSTGKSSSTLAASSGALASGAGLTPQSGGNSALSSPPSPPMQVISVGVPTTRTLTYPLVTDPKQRISHQTDGAAIVAIASLIESLVLRMSAQLDLSRLFWLPPPTHPDLAPSPVIVASSTARFKGYMYERIVNAIMDVRLQQRTVSGLPPTTTTTTAGTSRTSMASGSQHSDIEDPFGQPTESSVTLDHGSEDGKLTWLSVTDAIALPTTVYVGEMIYNPLSYLGAGGGTAGLGIEEGGEYGDEAYLGYDDEGEDGPDTQDEEMLAMAANALEAGGSPSAAYQTYHGASTSPSAAGGNLHFDPELMLREGSASVTHTTHMPLADGGRFATRVYSGSAALANDSGSPVQR